MAIFTQYMRKWKCAKKMMSINKKNISFVACINASILIEKLITLWENQ